MALKIWSHRIDLRGAPLELRRMKEGGSYSSELECLGVVLPIASCHNEVNAEWYLRGWVKTLSPILERYEAESFVSAPKKIDTKEDFAQAISANKRKKQDQCA